METRAFVFRSENHSRAISSKMAFLNGTSVLKLDLLELLFSRNFIVLLYGAHLKRIISLP